MDGSDVTPDSIRHIFITYTSLLLGRGTKIILERLFFQSLAHYKKIQFLKKFCIQIILLSQIFLISGFAGKMKVHFK